MALQLAADGIHIGQEDESLASIKNKLPDRIIGISAHHVAEARTAYFKVPIIWVWDPCTLP
jgi:thiamine-phosphate pyrophosphorylase